MQSIYLNKAQLCAEQNLQILSEKIVNGCVSQKKIEKSVENACKAKRAAVNLFTNLNISDKDKDKTIDAAEKALVYAEAVLYPLDKFVKIR